MSNVFQLPDSMNRQWGVFENKLRQALAATLDVDELEHVIAQLKPAYLECSRPSEAIEGETMEDVLIGINRWVSDVHMGLLMRLAVVEVQLYRARPQ